RPAEAGGLPLAAPAGITERSAVGVTMSSRDSYGNLAPCYAGNVHFTSSDAQATLPVDYTFTVDDQGSHAFTGVTLVLAGNQSLKIGSASCRARVNSVTVAVSSDASTHFGLPDTDASGSRH